MAPTRSLLEKKLPLHILDLVCEHLDSDSIASFSLANKHCFLAAERSRFRCIELRISTPDILLRDLGLCDDILQPGNRYRHVRQLMVVSGSQFLTELEADADSEALHPLARFIAKLPGLKDITFDGYAIAPRCIIESLHNHLPRCRLHVKGLNMRSLWHTLGPAPQADINPAEYAIVPSPSLHSISTVLFEPPTGAFDYNLDAILCMASGLAPNLKVVKVGWDNDMLDWGVAPPWRGFSEDHDQIMNQRAVLKGRLQTLEFEVALHTWRRHLESWTQATRFSELRSLAIRHYHDSQHSLLGPPREMLDILTEMAGNGELGSLRSIELSRAFRTLQSSVQSAEFLAADSRFSRRSDAALGRLLSALSPLEEIKLSGYAYHATFDAILSRHAGPFLRVLEVRTVRDPPSGGYFYFSSDRLEKLQQMAPNLEELSISIHRTQGDAQEVSIYRVLGKMRKLRKVSLRLNCIDGLYNRACERSSNAEPTPLMRDVMINAAIDETLAWYIFNLTFPTAAGCSEVPVPELVGQSWQLELSRDVELDSTSTPIFCAGALAAGALIREFRQALYVGYELSRKTLSIGTVDKDGRLKTISREMREPGLYRMTPSHQWKLRSKALYGDIWREIWPESENPFESPWSSFPLQL